jgi:hypothetical protein
MADVMRLAVGERVAAFGWVGCQYREGVVGMVVRFWVTGLGEWVYTIVLDVPEPDGVCLVEAATEDLVRLAPMPAKPVKRPRRPRRSRGA